MTLRRAVLPSNTNGASASTERVRVGRATQPIDPVDLVFDTVGGGLLTRSPTVLRPGGRLVSVAEEPPTNVEAGREIAAVYFVVEPNREQLVEIATLADSGELRPVVGEVFDLADARSAFARSMSRDTHGKVVLRMEARR
jgi:NADPH:quinone reductase-like Zn-dependent oxidoreductase